MKVFLGGTCNDSTWRENLIDMLPPHIHVFNPVVENWTEECQAEEERQKDLMCQVHLYVLTPKMTGVFSVAELVESSMTSKKITVFCYLPKDGEDTFTKGQMMSLQATANLVEKYGAYVCHNLTEVVECLEDIYDCLD